LSIAAHPVLAEATLLAPLLAATAVLGVVHHVDAAAAAARLAEPALRPALPAVLVVAHHVHALPPTAVGTGAAAGATNPREPVAGHRASRRIVLREQGVDPPGQRGWCCCRRPLVRFRGGNGEGERCGHGHSECHDEEEPHGH
ncbi:unnamed protein product, partial [Musa banksii]